MSRDLILLHGALGSSEQFNDLEKQLSSQNISVYTFNFSGHGREVFHSEFGIKQFSNELIEFITNKKLGSPDIFGYSMGGYVALYTAIHNPGSIGNISTLGTKFKWDKETSEKEIRNLDPILIEQKVPKFAERLKQLHGENWKELLKKTAEMMLAMGERNPISLQELSLLPNKVSIGLAENDKMVSVEETDQIAKLIQNASRFTLINSAHPIETADIIELSNYIIRN